MSRNIVGQSQIGKLAPGIQPDNYADRLVKMIPAEIVSLYLFLHSYVSENGADSKYNWLLWAIILLLCVLTPLYLKRIMSVVNGKQIFFTTLAFFFWCFTFGSPFNDLISDVKELKMISTVVLALYTFALPIFYKGD
jgi:hypothetical protein